MDWMIIVVWGARLVFALLVGLSVWSLSIIINRRRFFKTWQGLSETSEIKELLLKQQTMKTNSEDPRSQLLIELSSTQSHSRNSLFIAFVNENTKSWRKGLGVLGTLGATAPFIGLLGTILGIIVSFGELSQGQVEMKGVMFSLAEALLLTAVGLGVALPSVVAFNYFNKKIREMVADLETVKEYFTAFSTQRD